MDAIKCWLQQLVDEALPVAAVTVPNCQITRLADWKGPACVART